MEDQSLSKEFLALVRAIEHHSAIAWPALSVTQHYGWELRRSPPLVSRRVNSLNPVRPESGRFVDALTAARSLLAESGSALHVRMLPLADADAYRSLRSRGLLPQGETTVEILALTDKTAADPRVALSFAPSYAWLDAYMVADSHDVAEREALLSVLNAVLMPQAFAMVVEDGEPLAVGRGAISDGRLGIFHIATRADRRKSGLGRAIVSTLLDWGRRQAAEHAYLQVVTQNHPARALYRSFGFQPCYTYDYWTVPMS
jgi:GNAT superfamily N-acetyltransferase